MLDKIALTLLIIGGINWGSIGIFQFDIVAWIFGNLWSVVASICDRRTARDGRATAFGK